MHTLHEACILHTPVVDIDGVFPVLVAKVLGEDLHVSRQDNEVDGFLLKDLLDLLSNGTKGIMLSLAYVLDGPRTHSCTKKKSHHPCNVTHVLRNERTKWIMMACFRHVSCRVCKQVSRFPASCDAEWESTLK